MIIFCDENIPQAVASSIAPLAKCQVVHLLEQLPLGTKDEDVFRRVASLAGGVLLTQDAKIRKRKHQILALRQAGIGAFIVSGRAHRTMNDLAILIIRALPEIMSEATTQPPYVFAISDRSKLERLI